MSSPKPKSRFVSRAGEKLATALDHFGLDVADSVCADLGSHVGGFVDCLLQRKASKVFSVDTAYGLLAWTLRKDPRVVVMERTNAMHVEIDEQIDLVTIDVGWTRQVKILPTARKILAPNGQVVTLIKPQYEADRNLLREGVLSDEDFDGVIAEVKKTLESTGWDVVDEVDSPIRGHGGNREYLALLRRRPDCD